MRVAGLAGGNPNTILNSWRHGKIGTKTANRIGEFTLGSSIELLSCRRFPKFCRKGLRSKWTSQHCGLIDNHHTSEEYGLDSSFLEESFTSDGIRSAEASLEGESHEGPPSLLGDNHVVKMELILLALPAIAGQAIEPLAQLVETACIGRLGISYVLPETDERKALPSVSTALVLATSIGIFEAATMYIGSGLFLDMMGISSVSTMRYAAEQFLRLRAIAAPAVVVSLAIQGIFRGFKDTKTPLVLPSRLLLHSGILLGRTMAAVMTITVSTSMAARLGPIAMAAHQICLQIWLSVSLLADAQASSGQALIAGALARSDYGVVKEITYFSLKMGLLTGISLAIILGVSFGTIATWFTKDAEVLRIVRSGVLIL
ncbi:hypothetical protein V2J09_009881 [Rumex salicifolius]